MNLTGGDYNGVIAAAHAGTEAAPVHSVTVQLAAQEAKAWARIGDRRQTEVTLDRGRRLLEAMPYPENLDHHFVVDQATTYGEQALTAERKSVPSLVMVSRDLTKILRTQYPTEPKAKSYLDHLQALVQGCNLRQRR